MKKHKEKAVIVLKWSVLIFVGLCYILHTWLTGINNTREQAIKLARIVKSGFHYEAIASLDVSVRDLNKREYRDLKANLTRLAVLHDEISYAYIYIVKEKRVYIVADSEQEYTSDYSPPGQEHREATKAFYQAVDDNGRVIISDKGNLWGGLISVLIPIEDPRSGRAMAVFGMDYSSRIWYHQARRNTLTACITVICLLLLYGAANLILRNYKELRLEKEKLLKANEQLINSERNNALLLRNLPGMAYRCRCDEYWTMEYVSDGASALTGYTPEDLELNRRISFYDLISVDYRRMVREQCTQMIMQKLPFAIEYSMITATGEFKWVYENGQGIFDEAGNIEFVEGIIIDISDRKKRENKISYLSHHDTLTGLYNRRYFEEEIKKIDEEKSYPVSVIMGDINGLKLINDSFGHLEGDNLIVSIAKILQANCRETDILARTGGDEFSIILPNTTIEYAQEIVKKIEEDCDALKKTTLGDVYRLSISLGYAMKKSITEPIAQAIKEAEDNMYRHKMLQSKSLHSSIISSMKTTLFEKNKETEEHARRLIRYTYLIGQSLKLKDKQLDELELLSTLHDIGKIGISDLILNKPDKLSEEEWVEMKKHPEIGYRIAMSTSELAPIAEYILFHHERWDGTGYPQGLKGEEIPLLSRILAVADAYDAMTEDRPYRKALSKEKACQELRLNAGAQFDPDIVEVFLMELDQI